MGIIAESIKQSLSKNMDETMKLACSGLLDPHLRVRYAGMSCLALLLTELAPTAQKTYHAELVTALLDKCKNENVLKMKTHAVSTLINFCRGLVEEDDDEIEPTKKNITIMSTYAEPILTELVKLLNLAVE